MHFIINNRQDKVNKLQRNYIYINWIFLGLAIYVISFPIISAYITSIFPTLLQCPYKTLTGSPCPLCGGTRYFANLTQVFYDPSYLLQPFGIIAIAIMAEFVFRIICLVVWYKKKRIPTYIIRIDVVIHSIELFAFILYEISFFIK